MLVSAVSSHTNNGYKFANNIPTYVNYSNELNTDSYTTLQNRYLPQKKISQNESIHVFDSINQWKNFCQNNIVGEKLNVIV